MGTPLLDEPRNVPGQESGGVFDAVDAGVEHLVQGVLREAVGGDACAFVMRGQDGITHDGGRKAGCQVAGFAVDPVPDELDPAVAVAGLLAHGLHKALRFHLDGETAEVAPGARDVSAGADQYREVPAALHPPGIGGGTGVPHQQRARGEVRPGLVRGRGCVDRAARPQPDMAVGVNKAGQHPAVQDRVRCLPGTAEGQPAVHGPHAVSPRFRPGQCRTAEFDDLRHSAPLSRRPG